MEIEFNDTKVHNEIELCTVWDPDIKLMIERALLKHSISYYEKWDEPGFFGRLFGETESKCTICINRMQLDNAVEILDQLPLNRKDYEMILKRNKKTYF